jgi:hypothetical protein
MTVLLRYDDLRERNIVRSRPQLRNLQKNHGFPLGRMLSANTRTYTEAEVDEWLGSRPIANPRPLQGARRVRDVSLHVSAA